MLFESFFILGSKNGTVDISYQLWKLDFNFWILIFYLSHAQLILKSIEIKIATRYVDSTEIHVSQNYIWICIALVAYNPMLVWKLFYFRIKKKGNQRYDLSK